MLPTTLVMLMMRPKRCFIIGRIAARLSRNTAFRLVSSTASQLVILHAHGQLVSGDAGVVHQHVQAAIGS